MYSPKVAERLIHPLYLLGRARRLPMTHLVAEAVERYLASEGIDLEPTPERPAGRDGPRSR